MGFRNIPDALNDLFKRVTLLERRLGRLLGGGGVPYGVPLPFFGTAAMIPNRYIQPMGQTVSRITYRRLYAVFGNYYGAGDGSTTFVLPDLRGRTLVGLSTGDSDFGALGQKTGAKTHTLTAAQLPPLTAASAGSHTHTGTAASAGSHSHQQRFSTHAYSADDGNTMGGLTGSGGNSSGAATQNTFSAGAHTHSVTTVSAGAHTHTVNSGAATAHNNIQPSIACNWILKY